MTSYGNTLIVTALVASFAGAPASAQSTPALAASRALPSYVGAERAGASVADARRLAEDGRLRDARNVYRKVANAQMAAGEYAAEALYGLAQTEYGLDNPRAAASALDDLASEAGRFGDPEMRLRALFESALIYQDLGDRASVAERVPLIRALLKSPVIPEKTRQHVASRLGT